MNHTFSARIMLSPARTLIRWLAHGLIPDIASNARGVPCSALPPPSVPQNAGLAIVTGATGGLGSAVCHGLAERGFEVVVAARDATAGQQLVSDITAAGGTADFSFCDLSTPGGAAALASALLDRGAIALLVNNAGVMGGSQADTMAVNAIAPAVLTLGLMPQLAAAPSPRVVNVGSSAVRVPFEVTRPRYMSLLLDTTEPPLTRSSDWRTP